MRVTPNLHFNGQCAEALELYAKAFHGVLTVLMRHDQAHSSDLDASGLPTEQRACVYHAEMTVGGHRLMFSDSLEPVVQGQQVSTVITFDRPEQVRHAYGVLADGATVVHPLQETTYSSCFVSLVDKYGMRWELMTEDK